MESRKYVKDFIGDEYLQWRDGDKIIITTPTGSGKTTFVVSELLKYAVEQRNDDLTNTLMTHPQITTDRAKRFPFLKERKPTVTEVDCRSHIERDTLFFLRYQLRWIGKEYDVSCWLGYDSKMTALIGYLDSGVESDKWLREDDVWHEQRELARECLNRILALPEVPDVLLKDKSRYLSNPEKYPGKDKLEKCFKALSLPYTIISEQRRYEGKRKTCWKLSK